VYADSAYYSAETEAFLEEQGYNSKIQVRAYRNKALSKEQQADNTFKSRKRARVEHSFASIKGRLRGIGLRCIGLTRATCQIGLMNLVYNIARVDEFIRLRVFVFDRVNAPAVC